MAGVRMQFDPDAPGVVKFADDPAGLVTAAEFQCQVTSIALTPSAQTETLPATLCQAESDLAKASKWALELEILQDWTDPVGVSFYLYENDGQTKAFSVSYSAATAPVATGECSIVSAAFLGAASGPLAGTASLPCIGKPVISKPSAAMAAASAPEPESEPVG